MSTDTELSLSHLQRWLDVTMKERDQVVTKHQFMTILMEEVGELARAILENNRKGIEHELADVIYVSLSIANRYSIEVSSSIAEKFPRCRERSFTEIAPVG